jgi:hypothetical protein
MRRLAGLPNFGLALTCRRSVVPSQTVGQRLRRHKIAIANHNKTICVGRYLNQNLLCGPVSELKKIEELDRASECLRFYIPFLVRDVILWQIYAIQCFRLSYSDGLFTFRIFLPIHKSVGHCIKCHHRIDHLNQLNHYNN